MQLTLEILAWLILLTCALPLTRPLGLPSYVARIPAAPFSLGL